MKQKSVQLRQSLENDQLTVGNALLEAQRAAVEVLHARLMDAGWKAMRLRVDRNAGCIWSRRKGAPRLLFDQAVADQAIRDRVDFYRKLLPRDLRVQQLPATQIGGLAAHDIRAIVGYSNREADDFLAISIGIVKLRYWGIAVSRFHGVNTGRRHPARGISNDDLPRSWWQSSFRAIASDILGWRLDSDLLEKIVAWDFNHGTPTLTELDLWGIMEGFLILHEIGHYELNHGNICRANGFVQIIPSHWGHYMESEADAFAVYWLLKIYKRRGLLAAALSMIFMLFALEPDLLRLYPSSDDSDSHPHPLTRFVWVLRRIEPDTRLVTDYYYWLAEVLASTATVPGMNQEDEMKEAIFLSLLGKSDIPRRPDGDRELSN